jgi:hypothetical protein
VVPGISFSHFVLGFHFNSSSNVRPFRFEMSQHESPGWAMYTVAFFGQTGTGCDRVGQRRNRQIARRKTPIKRKKGSNVR